MQFLKSKGLAAWVFTHFFFVIMLGMLVYNYKMWEVLLSPSAYFAVGFFALVLALNPIIKIKRYPLVANLNKHRRQIGVACFSYAFIHASCFIIKRAIDGKWVYFLHPAILPVLLIGFPILFILAITSNDYSIKKLSGPRWKKLHNTVYIAQIAIICHMVLTHNTAQAIWIFAPLIALQLTRKLIILKNS